jgi:hypothetical protein
MWFRVASLTAILLLVVATILSTIVEQRPVFAAPPESTLGYSKGNILQGRWWYRDKGGSYPTSTANRDSRP